MITVYSKPACVQCNAVKRHLTNLGKEYEVIDLSLASNQAGLDYIASLGYLAVPVTVRGEDHFYGFQPDLLNAL